MDLILVHISDIHMANDKDYESLMARSELIASAINKHIIDVKNTILLFVLLGILLILVRRNNIYWQLFLFLILVKT